MELENSLEFEHVANKSGGITKSVVQPVDHLNLFGLMRRSLKKNDESYIQFENVEDKDIYYRMGIIDFL